MICLKCLLKFEKKDQIHYGLHLSCFMKWFDVPHAVDFISVQRKSNSSSGSKSGHEPQNISFFHGKFKKYSAELNNHSFIIKMRQVEAKELPEVEYLSNQIAVLVGIPVAEFFFIDFYGDKTFVTKNFIMPAFAPKDLQHIYHFRPDDQHSCAGIINAVAKKTKRPHDIRVIIKTILFDALIGNHDRHGRNLAFIVKAKEMILSPIYDNVSYLALEEGEMLKAHHNPTGRISTNHTYEPSMHDYVKELKRLGYEENIKEFYQGIKLDQMIKLIDQSFCSELMKEAIKTLVKRRFKEIENEIT